MQSNSYTSTNTSTNTKLGNYGSPKFGSSYTASSAYINERRPVLFKSSKYVISKTE